MKRALLFIIIYGFVANILFAQSFNLEEVIKRSARGIEDALPHKAMVAIINFASPAIAFSDHVIEELTDELLETGKITIVDRRNIEHIKTEMNLQLSCDVSDESMVSIGKIIGTQYIISGALTDMGTIYRFRIRIINVETAAIERQITNDLKNDEYVAYLLGGSQKGLKRANSRNSWILGSIYGNATFYGSSFSMIAYPMPGLSLQYERMINSHISLGAYLYACYLWSFAFGMDGFFRFYLWEKTFFLGISLGYSYINGDLDIKESGFAITPEIGWKIDIGKIGGFYIQPGLAFSILPANDNIPLNFQWYFGMGNSF